MPLTDAGKRILEDLIRKHGEKRGKEIFYAMENSGKYPQLTPRGSR